MGCPQADQLCLNTYKIGQHCAVLWSGGPGSTSCIMPQTAHCCPCGSDQLATHWTYNSGCAIWRSATASRRAQILHEGAPSTRRPELVCRNSSTGTLVAISWLINGGGGGGWSGQGMGPHQRGDWQPREPTGVGVGHSDNGRTERTAAGETVRPQRSGPDVASGPCDAPAGRCITKGGTSLTLTPRNNVPLLRVGGGPLSPQNPITNVIRGAEHVHVRIAKRLAHISAAGPDPEARGLSERAERGHVDVRSGLRPKGRL